MQTLPRTALSGPALVRLLARFADLDVPSPASSLADRLSQWLGWTDAIALSTALASEPPASAASASASSSDDEAAVARARASLVRMLTRDEGSETAARGRHRAVVQPPPDVPVEFTLFRQRYLSLQQTMESDIGALRGKLRAAVAARSAGMMRLVVVDAVMEQALAARERTVLAQVPALLGKHFERLKRAHAAPVDGVETSGPHVWLDAFRKDMQGVLLAELDIRFQPVEALLAALRSESSI